MGLNSNIIAVIQARMGSTRLPGKTLKVIQDKPMLWHIAERLNQVEAINEVIVATSDLQIDDPVFEMAQKYDISCYRGSESNVLKRFYETSLMAKADYVIRVTGDCPLVDPKTVSELIRFFFDGDYDFCGIACGAGVANEENINRFPDGLDAEIFSLKVLKEANIEANTDLEREHVTPFIWKKNNRYSLGLLSPNSKDYSDYRLTVDNKEDFDFVRWIYDMLYPQNNNFNFYDVMVLLEKYPEKLKNKHLIGLEGYDEFWK